MSKLGFWRKKIFVIIVGSSFFSILYHYKVQMSHHVTRPLNESSPKWTSAFLYPRSLLTKSRVWNFTRIFSAYFHEPEKKCSEYFCERFKTYYNNEPMECVGWPKWTKSHIFYNTNNLRNTSSRQAKI